MSIFPDWLFCSKFRKSSFFEIFFDYSKLSQNEKIPSKIHFSYENNGKFRSIAFHYSTAVTHGKSFQKGFHSKKLESELFSSFLINLPSTPILRMKKRACKRPRFCPCIMRILQKVIVLSFNLGPDLFLL